MSVTKTQARFNSTDGKSVVNTLIWRDESAEPVAVIQLSHGLTDHIARYERFARYLAERGFVVCGNDHIGHGLTAESTQSLGDFGAADAVVRMVDDMHRLHNIMIKKYSGLPYFLLGHSMGSLLARIYAADFGEELTGLILVGTVYIENSRGLTGDAVYTLSDILGSDKFSSAFIDTMGKITSRLIYKEDDDTSWLSLSKENRDEALYDPYFNYPITRASLANVVKAMLKSSSQEVLSAIPPSLPVMLIAGAKDPVGSFGRTVAALCDKLEENGNDTQMILYPGLRHELLCEDDYEKIYSDVINWCFNALSGGML